jgi:predicted Zn-dependent peptidase
MLTGLFNGRTGRLHRSLVLEQEIAFSAYSQFTPLEQGGVLSMIAEAKSGTPPATLLAALDREVERLLAEPPGPREIDKVRNQLRANAFRRLKEPSELMMELLLGPRMGETGHLERWLIALQAVDGARLQEMAKRYLNQDARVVGLFDRSGDPVTEARTSGRLP